MLLTQIRIQNKYDTQTKLKGIATIVFDKALAVHDIKILKSSEEYFLAMPSRKIENSKSTKEFSDIVHPINKEMREILEKIILISYEYCVVEKYSSLHLEMTDHCKKVNVFEQDISDFEIVEEKSQRMIDTQERFDKTLLNIHIKEAEVPFLNQKNEDEEVKMIPIYNYVPGVIFKKVDSIQESVGEKKLWRKLAHAGIHRQLTTSDVSILQWIGKLEYATGKNIYALIKGGIIEKSPNYIFNEEKVKKRLSHTLVKSFQLIDVCKFTDTKSDREYKTNVYMVSTHGNNLLRSLNLEYVNNNYVLNLQDVSMIKKTMAQNQWFCNMVEEYAEVLEFYDIDVIMDTENSLDGRANVKIYINVGEQPVFAEAFRKVPKWDNNIHIQQCYNKIQRLSLLASDYENVTINLRNAGMKRRPIIVIIGENEEHCKELHEIFKTIKTDVKIVYTHDVLIANDIEHAHFQFIDGEMKPFDLLE